jgi:hypothetical protein
MESLRQVWSKSKVFRVILIIAIIYTSLRLLAQVYLSVERMLPGQSQTQIIPNDLQDYLDAATRLVNHQPLYPFTSDYGKYYQYPPVFALAIRPLLFLPPGIDFILNFILRLVAYYILFIWWARIFKRARMRRAFELWAWTLPIWLVFSGFWSDLAYMNIYIITAMFVTLLLDAVMAEDLVLSVLWFSVLLQTKPFWAFAIAIPLLLGRWKFFLKLLLAGIAVNTLVIGGFLLIVGPAYGWQQHIGFIQFLVALDAKFPWRTQAAGFLGYNHSIMQIIIFVFGNSPENFRLATIIKVILLIPLIVLCVRNLLHPAKRPGYAVPELALGLAFALYLGVYIWLDMVWEVSLGCAIFIYLLSLLDKEKISKVLVWLVFLPYVLIDVWQIGSYAILGDQVFTAGGDYIVTDYSIYVPIVMIVILVFYAILIKQLWSFSPKAAQTASQGN